MTTLAPPATIAFLGLGMMGRPMAARLAEACRVEGLKSLVDEAVNVGAAARTIVADGPSAQVLLAGSVRRAW